jgi:branched-chain amino acid transport system ATP-binding protein
MTAILHATGLAVGYGGVPFVTDFSLSVEPGEVVAIIGANGAGKTTALLGLAGAIPALRGSVTFGGVDQSAGLAKNARRGMALLTDDRSIFKELTVWENLRLGRGTPEAGIAAFPQLERLQSRKAGLLSGGEQQMLGLARVIAARPKLLLADELSLGLAPIVVKPLLASIRQLADSEGVAAILVEQHVRSILEIADTAVILQRGKTVFAGSAHELRGDSTLITQSYFSGSDATVAPAAAASVSS